MAIADTARISEPAKISNPTQRASLQNDVLFGEWNQETTPDKKWKILLYGVSGSGKTHMAGTFEDPLFLDLEDGMRSLLHMKKRILRYPKDPSVQITEWSQVKTFYNTVVKMKPDEAPFKTIVIDSLNELQLLSLNNALKIHNAERLYQDQPTMGDYGKLARDMQATMRSFYQLPYNIIFTCASSDVEFEDEKRIPLLVGKKSGPDIRRISEQVGYCFTAAKKDQPTQHLVGFRDNPKYLAKDRTPYFSTPVENSFQAMQEAIRLYKEREKSKR